MADIEKPTDRTVIALVEGNRQPMRFIHVICGVYSHFGPHDRFDDLGRAFEVHNVDGVFRVTAELLRHMRR